MGGDLRKRTRPKRSYRGQAGARAGQEQENEYENENKLGDARVVSGRESLTTFGRIP